MEPPQFCPWCGSPVGYAEHDHEPRYRTAAREAELRGETVPLLPERVGRILAGASYVAGCPGCRTVTHVIGHRAE
jgi:hypothetical protein